MSEAIQLRLKDVLIQIRLQSKNQPPAVISALYENCLNGFPWSYQLWQKYLQFRVALVKEYPPDHEAWLAVNNLYERSLSHMVHMPRIWSDYLRILIQQGKVKKCREVFDRSLKALPITQHSILWKVFLQMISKPECPLETMRRSWHRYLLLEPAAVEDYIDILEQRGAHKERANALIKALDDPLFYPTKGKTRHQLWVVLCELLGKVDCPTVGEEKMTVEEIIRSGIAKFPAEIAQLWVILALHYSRQGQFEQARAVYEEGILATTTVKDFTQIFNAYLEFEESLLTATADSKEGTGAASDTTSWRRKTMELYSAAFDDDQNVSYLMDRLTNLLERRPELLNSVMLRQNPHNIHHWLTRVKIMKKNDPSKIPVVFAEAVKSIDPKQAQGKLSELWIGLMRFYEEERGELETARAIAKKGSEGEFSRVEDLASLYLEWAAMELRHDNYDHALAVYKQGTATPHKQRPKNVNALTGGTVQSRLWQSNKLWTAYAELDEALCEARKVDLDSTYRIYDKMFKLKCISAQNVIACADIRLKKKDFDGAWETYERGVDHFHWPHSKPIWTAYVRKFVKKYKGTRLDRARDIFTRAVKSNELKMFLLYASFEETFGLHTQCMAVYSQAAKSVLPEERPDIYRRWAQKAKEFKGDAAAVVVYEQGVKELPNDMVPSLAIEWIETEIKLGEAERARSLFSWCAQLVPPAKEGEDPPLLYSKWKEFEIASGTEDTYSDMLRCIRKEEQRRTGTRNFG